MKPIVQTPTPVLREKAQEVALADITSPKIKAILKEMAEALRRTPEGIGIAAPQLGYSLRIFLASEEALKWDEVPHEDDEEKKRKKQEWQYYTFINPKITKISRKKLKETEGCLSVTGVYGEVERAEKVTVEAYDERGEKFTRGTSRLYARLMQHEIDHLEGALFIDMAKNIKTISDKDKKE